MVHEGDFDETTVGPHARSRQKVRRLILRVSSFGGPENSFGPSFERGFVLERVASIDAID